jgi:ferrochelatase
MANLVVGEVSKLSPEQQAEGVDVLFSAHGVPQGYLKVGDLYQSHIEESMLMISREVGTILADSDQCPAAILPALKTNLRFHLSYQSRVGPVPWLRPYTDDKIRELGKKGARNLAVVPIAFVSEHIETLEEIDGEYR